MKKCILSIIVLLLPGFETSVKAQVAGASDHLVAHPIPDRSLAYNVSDTGVYKPIIWGLDLAWLSEGNIRRGIAFMGAERVDIIRSSFTPTAPLVDGELQEEELGRLNERLDIIKTWLGPIDVALNCDHPTVDPWFVGNASRWAQLIDVTAGHHEEAGHKVVAVAPFNEPDYGWGQGTIDDFYNIAGELRKIPRFDSIRISGGNTLNCDEALSWYNRLNDRLDEGNTHQLAGSFNNYAEFFKAVRDSGDHATNDELHNVMEAMVGVEYGLQTGIWWGTAELARGEFVKAGNGRRLGYAEHRSKWTAASVYRSPEGKVQAFGGSSERQAATTTYRFISTERDVFYDGYGPQREYTMGIPGGTGYQQGQTNAERVVDITWGDDVRPAINGRYMLVNRNSGLVMEVADGSAARGVNLQQGANTGATYQQWNVLPVSSRIGGDFSYFTITAAHSSKAVDIYNWSLDDGGNLVVWDDTKGGNQQWYLEYVEDGWFYIRSRHSAKCLEVADSSSAYGANIQQWEPDGGTNQQWRFLPIGAQVDFDPPVAPNDLTATANTVSVRLDWSAEADSDVMGYTIFRADSAKGTYNTIARSVISTSFVDNTVLTGKYYYYAVKAVDSSLNRSVYSNVDSAYATGSNDLAVHLSFDADNTRDSSMNLNHGAPYGGISYVGNTGSRAIKLNGTDAFVQMPSYLANHEEITVTSWVYWNGGAAWQRIFDFGSGQDEYMFLTPGTGTGQLRFAIKNGGSEQILDAPAMADKEWAHVAVTLGESGARIYVNGEPVAESGDITINPLDFKPILNYIGRSQFPDRLFNGYIDDFRVYNYELQADEIVRISEVDHADLTDVKEIPETVLSLWPVPANDVLYVNCPIVDKSPSSMLTVFNANGRTVMIKNIQDNNITLDILHLPSGIYMLRLANDEGTMIRKFMVDR